MTEDRKAWWRNLLEHVAKLRAGKTSTRVQWVMMWLALALFFGFGAYALHRLDLSVSEVQPLPLLLVAVVGVPLTTLKNAAEYALSAKMLGIRVRLLPALRVSVIANAANLLPIPGAVLVRVQAVQAQGSTYRGALSTTLVVGLIWLGVSALVAGGWLAATGMRWVGSSFVAPGIGILVSSYAILTRFIDDRGARLRVFVTTVLLQAGAVCINAMRLYLIIVGVGIQATPTQAFVLALASSLSSAAGIFPGGLGLREVIAAALAPLVGLPPSAGFVAAGVNRVIGLLTHAPITAGLMLKRRTEPAPVDEPAAPTKTE